MVASASSMPTGPVLGTKTKPKPASAPTPTPAPVPAPPVPAIAPAKLPKNALGKAPVDPKSAAEKQEELAKKAIWAAATVFGLLIVYMIAGRLLAVVTRWPTTVVEPVAASHCSQFIDLAKLAHGENWRVRLDPRDTTCAQQVKDEWERQKLTRYVPPPQPLFGPVADAPGAPVARVTRRAPETRCLNVISLAKTKYGAEWRSKLVGEEAVCAAEPEAPAASVGVKPPATPEAPLSPAAEAVSATPTASGGVSESPSPTP
jgi:hypothetical protein